MKDDDVGNVGSGGGIGTSNARSSSSKGSSTNSNSKELLGGGDNGNTGNNKSNTDLGTKGGTAQRTKDNSTTNSKHSVFRQRKLAFDTTKNPADQPEEHSAPMDLTGTGNDIATPLTMSGDLFTPPTAQVTETSSTLTMASPVPGAGTALGSTLA